jgi:dTDP-4-amino-4,6-dideoxygalactose transaminase
MQADMRNHASTINSKLAIDGGEPVRHRPFAPWPHFSDDAIDAGVEVLRSGKINYWSGEHGRCFEEEFASFVGRKHGVALANGTVALEAALHALQIGPGDEVIVPSRTFIASASCVVTRGATPVVADVDATSQNLTADTIRAVLSPRTRAVIAVHLAGWPCDMDPIMQLARAHNLKVIEDCAQCHGATYKGRMTGALGDIAAFSFCHDKIMTTCGEGGMVVTDDENAWHRVWSLKDHGKDYMAAHSTHGSSQFRWLHNSFGTNWRMTEVQSAVGRVLLRTIDAQLHSRRQHAAMLNTAFATMPALRVTLPPEHVAHAYYKYYAFIRPEALRPGWTRDRVLSAVNAEGIPCFQGICSEIYLEEAFSSMRPPRRLPVARELGGTSLMFLVHPTLTEADMHDVSRAVTKVFSAAMLPDIAKDVEPEQLQAA